MCGTVHPLFKFLWPDAYLSAGNTDFRTLSEQLVTVLFFATCHTVICLNGRWSFALCTS
jgi:hypothetical protein